MALFEGYIKLVQGDHSKQGQAEYGLLLDFRFIQNRLPTSLLASSPYAPTWKDLLHLITSNYALGVLLFGNGMLIATTVNHNHLVPVSFLTTTLELAIFLFFKTNISSSAAKLSQAIYLLPEWLVRYHKNGLSRLRQKKRHFLQFPDNHRRHCWISLLFVGKIPDFFLPFMLSLWLPAIGLLTLGFLSLLTSI